MGTDQPQFTERFRFSLLCSSMAARSRNLIIVALLAILSVAGDVGLAGGVVDVCTDANLRAALTGGGTVTFACDGTIVLTNTLVIDHDTIIDGSGHAVVISGDSKLRVFQVNTGITFNLKTIMVASGLAQGANGTSGVAGGDGFGAGILNLGGTVNLLSCGLTNHLAVGGKGTATDAGGQGRGGAVCNIGGQVNLTNCLVANNWATGGSVGFAQFAGPPAGDAYGGALYSDGGTVFAQQCILAGNNAVGGTPPFNMYSFSPAGGGAGGAIYASSGFLSLNGCLLQTNAAMGGISPYSGNGAGFAHGGALALASGTGQISHATFLSNTAQGGRGIRYSSGGVAFGGAVDAFADLSIVNSRFSTNLARGGTGFAAGLGRGGAISGRGRLSISSCTIDNNETRGGDGASVSINAYAGTNGCGGGIYAESDLRATNVTLVANRALGGDGSTGTGGFAPGGSGQGGGVCVSAGAAIVVHATLFQNTARGGAGPITRTNQGPAQGGGIAALTGTTTLFNSILASSISGSNCFGSIVDGGNNLSSDSSCQFTAAGSKSNIDPRLGPFDDYGGPTPTMPLLTGSPAIDAAAAAQCAALDQRGIARPYGGGCDIGAFESAPPYTIRGHVHGYVSSNGTTVSIGTNTATVDTGGFFAVNGFSPGTYTATPAAGDSVFVLSNRVLNLGPDIVNADFTSYRSNAWTVAVSNNIVHLVLAGAGGQTYHAFDSTNFTQWSIFTNSVMPASGVLQWDVPTSQPARFFKSSRP